MRPFEQRHGLACLRAGCLGRIRGRFDMRHGEQWFEGDEHDCPNCGAGYVIEMDGEGDDGRAVLLEQLARPEVSHG